MCRIGAAVDEVVLARGWIDEVVFVRCEGRHVGILRHVGIGLTKWLGMTVNCILGLDCLKVFRMKR